MGGEGGGRRGAKGLIRSGVVSIYIIGNGGGEKIRAQQPAPLARSWRSRWTKEIASCSGKFRMSFRIQ
jgi:hypothetical protein